MGIIVGIGKNFWAENLISGSLYVNPAVCSKLDQGHQKYGAK